MTFILRARKIIGKTINPLVKLFLKYKTKRKFIDTVYSIEGISTKELLIEYLDEKIIVRHIVNANNKVIKIQSAFYYTEENNLTELMENKLSMYPIILKEAISMSEFKEVTMKEVKDTCNVEVQESNYVEFIWGDNVIMRSGFKAKRFDTNYFVAVSSDGLDFDRFYDVYDYLDQPPLFFSKEKYKKSFMTNLKSLFEEELN